MKINEHALKEFVQDRFDDVVDDYGVLNELCETIIEFNELYDVGNAIAAMELIRGMKNQALETKSYIEESLAVPLRTLTATGYPQTTE